MTFGGRIAEEMFTGDMNTGVYGDIRQATGIARKMVTRLGHERSPWLRLLRRGRKQAEHAGHRRRREYSEETAKAIDEEVKKLIDSLYEETRKLLEANKDRIEAVAKALMKYETLDSNDIDRIMHGDILTKPTVGELLEREQSQRSTIIQPSEGKSQPDIQLGGGHLPAPG